MDPGSALRKLNPGQEHFFKYLLFFFTKEEFSNYFSDFRLFLCENSMSQLEIKQFLIISLFQQLHFGFESNFFFTVFGRHCPLNPDTVERHERLVLLTCYLNAN